MHKLLTSLVIFLLTVSLAEPSAAATREEKRVRDATEALNQLLRIPEQSVPPSLLSRAYAVAVVPNVVKAAFGVGARHGKGIIVVRQDDNTWSNPAFVALTGGGFGFQIGAQSTDIILVFKSRRGVEGITSGTLTLGADASIAAGPVGRHSSAATDFQFQAEVYSYSRSRGLFAGIALEGTGVTMDRRANAAFYGSPDVTPEAIFSGPSGRAPGSAAEFVQLLTVQTSRLPIDSGMATSSPRPAAAPRAPEQPATVKTYGIPGSGDAEEGE